MVISSDTQEIIVAALLKNSYLLSICKDEIDDGYFSDGSCKIIYKSLITYYNKYNALPSLNEMIINIDDCFIPTIGVTLKDVKDLCEKLYARPEAEEQFIKDKITDFIRKVRSSEALKSFIDKLKINPNLENDSVVFELAKALDVQLSTTKVFSMDDDDQIKQIRTEAIGTEDQSKIIRSFIPSLNQSLAFGGYQPSTVNMIVAPPGCFDGDTRLMFPDGSTDTLRNLSMKTHEIKLMSSEESSYIIQKGTAAEVIMTKKVKELYDIEIENIYHVKCTTDHPFMLLDGTYKKAEDLEAGDKLRGVFNYGVGVIDHNSSDHTYALNFYRVTKTELIKYNEEIPVFGVVDAKPYGNYAIALNHKKGIFVHNTGKSMFLINEGVNAARQGFNVLHIFIGDMVEYDGFIRYLSCVSGCSQNSLITATSQEQTDLVKFCNQQYNNLLKRINILAYPSLSLSIDTLIEEINKFEKHLDKDYGMIIIDYPDNLIQEGKSLYEDGGTLYSALERLARLTKSVLMVASQPGKAYWNHSIIPLEAAAESSKKQQCVDNMLTMNTENRGAEFGTFLLAKARKGTVGKIFRFKTDYAKCKIEEIPEAEYNSLKASLPQYSKS